jgi:hypothetical protein
MLDAVRQVPMLPKSLNAFNCLSAQLKRTPAENSLLQHLRYQTPVRPGLPPGQGVPCLNARIVAMRYATPCVITVILTPTYMA